MKIAVAKGVRIAAGCDIFVSGQMYGQSGTEILHLINAGMTDLEAIEAATANGPETLGPQAPRSGQLAVGYDADVIALDTNPLEDRTVVGPTGSGHPRLAARQPGQVMPLIVEGDYAADGAVCVRQAFTDEHIAWATEAIDANLADLVTLGQTGQRRRRRPVHRGLLQLAALAGDGAIHSPLTGRGDRGGVDRFVDDPALPRPRLGEGAGNEAAHAVAPGSAVLQRRRAPERQHVVPGRPGTPGLDAGVHRRLTPWARGTCPARSSTARQSGFPKAHWPSCPTSTADPDRWRVIGWELEPGDAVFFNMLTVHGAGGVEGPHRRRVLSVRMLGDDMVHAPRPWTTSPPFDELDLDAGAPMDHPLFPVLFRAG